MAGAPGRSPVRAVLLDLAGTLAELREPVGRCYAAAAEAQGVRIPAARLEDAFHRVLAAAPANLHPGLSAEETRAAERGWWRERVRETFRAADQMLPLPDFESLFANLFEHYAGARAWRLRPGAARALEVLEARGLALGVVSDFDYRLPGLLEALGIARHFGAVARPGEVGARKPDPRIFLACLERLGVDPGAAVHVGDDPARDLAGARRAGLSAMLPGDLATLPERLRTLERQRPENA